MKLSFESKVKNLINLRGNLRSASILSICILSFREWNLNNEECKRKINSVVGEGPYIVRSSAKEEDQKDISNAGKFYSAINVCFQDLNDSIEKVFDLPKTWAQKVAKHMFLTLPKHALKKWSKSDAHCLAQCD